MTENKKKEPRSIRFHITATMAVSFLLMFVMLYFLFSASMQSMLSDREAEAMQAKTNLAKSLLRSSVEEINELSLEWSRLEYTSEFVETGDKTLPICSRNFQSDETYIQNQVNFLVILDAENQVLFERFYDYRNAKEIEHENLSALYEDIGTDAKKATIINGISTGNFGFIKNEKQIYYISAYPVFERADKQKVIGTMLFGRIMDNPTLQMSSSEEDIKLTLLSVDDVEMRDGEAERLHEDGSFVRNDESVSMAFGALADIHGNPTLLLNVEDIRVAYSEENLFINAILFFLACACAVILMVLLRLLSKMIISPLKALSDEVRKIDVERPDTVIKERSNNEEVYLLTTSINGLIGRIREDREVIRSASESLAKSASYDYLTKLLNRMSAVMELEKMIKQSDSRADQISVYYFDISRFKITNDTLGHSMGDAILHEVARRLECEFLDGEILARMSGDKFLVATDTLLTKQARQDFSERIYSVFANPFVIKERSLTLTVSLGSSLWPDDAGDAEGLLKNAEIAMYKSKERGVGLYLPYHDSFQNALQRKLFIENRLRNAINNGCNEFVMYYQPKISIATNRINKCEALLRWQSPEGMIGPNEFIPLAEESGLIVPLSWWIIRECCKTGKFFEEKNHNISIAINVPAQVLMHDDFLKVLKAEVKNSGINPKKLDIEITEGTLLEDLDRVNYILSELHKMGIEISVDDFGTGYSSLSYLNRLTVDRIKIDRSFICGIEHSEESRTLVRAIMAMAKSLGFVVTAEGVEEPEQYRFLNDIVCDEVQGYIISKPITRDEFLTFCDNWNSDDRSFFEE